MDELVTCEYCGNEWDGNAQCDCYNYIFSESDLQIMDISPPSSFGNIELDMIDGNDLDLDLDIMDMVSPRNREIVELNKCPDETIDDDEIERSSLCSDSSIEEVIDIL